MFILIDPVNNVLDAKKAFVSVSLFNLMQFPLAMLPRTIASVVALSISVKRLNRFFNSPQLQNYVGRSDDVSDGSAIVIEKGTFTWEKRTAVGEVGGEKGPSEKGVKPSVKSTAAFVDENSTSGSGKMLLIFED